LYLSQISLQQHPWRKQHLSAIFYDICGQLLDLRSSNCSENPTMTGNMVESDGQTSSEPPTDDRLLLKWLESQPEVDHQE
jgi:hypothetical protein